MNIYGIMSTDISKDYLSASILLSKKLQNSLLIDSYNGFRPLDIMTGKTEAIYDIFDFNKMGEEAICKGDDFDFLPASYSKDFQDFDFKSLEEKIKSLSYDNVIISIPLLMEGIENYLKFINKLIILTQTDDLSLRNTEKILYSCQKIKRLIATYIIFQTTNKNIDFNNEKYKFLQRPKVEFFSMPQIYDNHLKNKNFTDFMEKLAGLLESGEGKKELSSNTTKSILKRIFKI